MGPNRPSYDPGLVSNYIDQVSACGVSGKSWTDVKRKVSQVVQAAAKHFAVGQSGTEIGNLRGFSAYLAMYAELYQSQSKDRAMFRYAKHLVDEIIRQRENP